MATPRPVKVIYSPRYAIDLGLHVFPTRKYRLVHERLLDAAIVQPADLVEPTPATWGELALVHTPEYLQRLRTGDLDREQLAQLELPWSAEMVEGFRLMTGGTVLAARIACALPTHLTRGTSKSVVAHIGGGLHHAFPNHGEGFCPFNDVAVAARVLQAEGVERIAVIDCDVHHGNGTAFIFNPGGAPPLPHSDRRPRPSPGQSVSDAAVFTFSIHQQHNYPIWKPRGSLDIGLPDGTRDEAYLEALERALPQVLAHEAQCVFYLAGADPYEDDQLGGLRLTKEGLRARDRMVIEAVCAAGVPLVIALAGGYARHVEDTVAIHVATLVEATKAVTNAITTA